jgi:arylsulfatase A-like enzyme
MLRMRDVETAAGSERPSATRARTRSRVALAVLCHGFCLLVAGSAVGGEGPRPNIIVIMSDDQRFDSLWAMPLLQEEMIARGVHFTDAFTTVPVCCPMRASTLAGGFQPWSTNVIDNQEPNGGVLRFNDTDTLATRLQASGYTTALIGKYLNGYPDIAPYVAPGWTSWRAAVNVALEPPGPFVLGSSGATSSIGQMLNNVTQYGTDYMRDRALDFIDAHLDDPFFLFLALAAPHTPSTPAPQDAGLFPDYLWRGRAWGEPDPSDKPARVRAGIPIFPTTSAQADLLHRDMLRSLRAVDRAVKAVMDRLEERELLDRTYVVYLSDNGYLWGEHYLFGKGEPYEEAIRVPLVVVGPGVEPRVDARLVTANLDLAATIQDIAGLPLHTQGTSFLPLLHDAELPGRTEAILFYGQQWEAWSALRSRDAAGDWKYTEWSRAIPELYDLAADPFEEHNLAQLPAYATIRNQLRTRLVAGRGLAVTTHFVPRAIVNAPYTTQLARWGGVPPFTWSIVEGTLPDGLEFDTATGRISGTPTRTETQNVKFQVRDSSVGMHSGEPQSYDQVLPVVVLPSCADGFDNDGDGPIDLEDPGCSGPEDESERSARQCDDGVDNDGDAHVDLDDPGCPTPNGKVEAPACDDGRDNDHDGKIDWADPRCTHEHPGTEYSACGIGAELALLLPVLGWLGRRRTH